MTQPTTAHMLAMNMVSFVHLFTESLTWGHGTEGEGNILQSPAFVIQPTRLSDLTSTHSVCTRRVFGGIGHQTQASGKESDALTTRLPTAPVDNLHSFAATGEPMITI
ncbi:hypothetical protein TNCV_1551741 [Trichonephila clavipes]|nr:hypothetical protein TNCV_1551741 [Trichonephila clavipes]